LATWTFEEAQEFYDEAKAAYKAALKSYSYGTGDRTLTRQKLETLEKSMLRWKGVLDDIKSGASQSRPKVKRGVPYV